MTSLIRTRAATSEMTRLFDAKADFGLTWGNVIWPGEAALVVTEDNGHRRLSAMRWSLPALAFVRPVPAKQRGILFARDLGHGGRLNAPNRLRRCLIIIEAFAYPSDEGGQCTRSWFGLTDRPLSAWAGFCEKDAGGCAGLLTCATLTVATASDNMPLLLSAKDHIHWLSGGGLLSLSPREPDEAHYHENFGERWSTGVIDSDRKLQLAVTA